MKCDRCGRETAPEEAMARGDGYVCEDCLMSLLSPAKACDPWAVKIAKGSVKTDAEAVASLQGVEKRMYDLICAAGEVPKASVAQRLGVTQDEADRAAATLRHLELLRAKKLPDGTIVVTRFSA